jgi:hypothetical protein
MEVDIIDQRFGVNDKFHSIYANLVGFLAGKRIGAITTGRVWSYFYWCRNVRMILVCPTGIEPVTLSLEGCRKNGLTMRVGGRI